MFLLTEIQYCKNIAREFRKAIEKEEKPDVIHCSWPLIELGYECVKYGRKYNIPVVLDIERPVARYFYTAISRFDGKGCTMRNTLIIWQKTRKCNEICYTDNWSNRRCRKVAIK